MPVKDDEVFITTLAFPLGNGKEWFLRVTTNRSKLLRVEKLLRLDVKKDSGILPPVMTAAIEEIRAYLNSRKPAFAVPYQLEGTEFRQRVWQEIARIPFGETITYKELARRAGNEKAIRAAAAACGANPVPLVIPCHRVVASSGALQGFAWGLDAKSFLLKLEQAAGQRKVA